jgi:hypothetical protein
MERRQVFYQRKTKQNPGSVWMVGMTESFEEDVARKPVKFEKLNLSGGLQVIGNPRHYRMGCDRNYLN